MFKFTETKEGVTFSIRVQPRASRSEIIGEIDGALKVRLAAPPVDGAANDECLKFFAKLFGIARSQVEIVSGHTGRNKIIRLRGVTVQELESRFQKT